jgi:hypothetical protein
MSVKPLKEKKPRTTVYPTSTAPAVETPGTPSSSTETRQSGRDVERSRVRTAPGQIPAGRQSGTTDAPPYDRSQTTESQGIRVAPQPAAPQPIAPTPVWKPLKPQKPQIPASTVQPAARTPLPQVQSPAAVFPMGQQQPSQPLKIQRSPSPPPQSSNQGQQMNRNQSSGQQPKIRQPSGQKPAERQESESKEKTKSKATGTQQQTGTVETPPLYPSQGQGRTGPR